MRHLLLALVACSQTTTHPPSVAPQPSPPPIEEWQWVDSSVSPLPIATDLSDRERELLGRCGTGDEGLQLVARHLVDGDKADLLSVSFAQRAAGEPHVWPRTFVVSGRALDHESTLVKLMAFTETLHDRGVRRCGAASRTMPDGKQAVAIVTVDALADLIDPLPTRTHAGKWLGLRARMLVDATAARVIVVGPDGFARGVPTTFEGREVRATFAPDRPGEIIVQVVAKVATGPRPVLEARVFADVDPPSVRVETPAPGEAADDTGDRATALFQMLNALRTHYSLSAVARDPALDKLAAKHTEQMRKAHLVGHDVGDGDPSMRVAEAGLDARETGECVAHAPTVALAHRALFDSPSHRMNLQHGPFDRVGVAVSTDDDGTVWVAEIFARSQRSLF